MATLKGKAEREDPSFVHSFIYLSFFAGLTGRFCDVNIDDCVGEPCGALSICKDTLNGYTCFCAPGFIGE